MDDLLNRAIVRPRAEADISVLCKVLAGQQPGSHYPLEWPLPFPVETFIARDREQRAWVAEVDRRTVGHISIVTVDKADEGLARCWSEAAGVGVDALACVAAFFVGLEQQGNGVGGLWLDAAVTWARARGMVPVLDVVRRAGGAVDVYRHRGWRDVGEARPAWLPDGELLVLLMILPSSATVPRPQLQKHRLLPPGMRGAAHLDFPAGPFGKERRARGRSKRSVDGKGVMYAYGRLW